MQYQYDALPGAKRHSTKVDPRQIMSLKSVGQHVSTLPSLPKRVPSVTTPRTNKAFYKRDANVKVTNKEAHSRFFFPEMSLYNRLRKGDNNNSGRDL